MKRGGRRPGAGRPSADAQTVGGALALYFVGASLRGAEQAGAAFGASYSRTSVLEWVRSYGGRASAMFDAADKDVGLDWVADEAFESVGGVQMYIFNVMDRRSRYLLAASVEATRNLPAARRVMKAAVRAAARFPATVTTDRLASYPSAIWYETQRRAKHVKSDGIRAEINNNLSERMQGTIRARLKVVRGLERQTTAQAWMSAFRAHYNGIRPHQALRNRTPAMAARITGAGEWRDDWPAVVESIRAFGSSIT